MFAYYNPLDKEHKSVTGAVKKGETCIFKVKTDAEKCPMVFCGKPGKTKIDPCAKLFLVSQHKNRLFHNSIPYCCYYCIIILIIYILFIILQKRGFHHAFYL